jgi:copper homeostasis protein
LQSNGTLDTEYLSSLVQTFPDTEWVCHRCFDLTPNPDFALEQLVSLGFSRILTSGHQRTAVEGYELIRHLLEIANGRIEIMAGSGIRSHNVRAFLGSFHASALDSVHASCWKEHHGLVNSKGEVDFGPDLSVDQMKVEALVREVFG